MTSPRIRSLAVVLAIAGLASAPPASPAQNAPLPPASAQVPQPQALGYPVIGRVICADTQRPARFAQVMLIPAASGMSDYDRGRVANGRTDLDGQFTIPNVTPGEYFVAAQATGYIDDDARVRVALSQGGDALNSISSVPRIQVTAGGASVQLSLQRGGVLAGAVQWDDGSPASGVQVYAQPAPTTTGGAAPPSGLGTLGSGAGAGFGPTFFPGSGAGAQTDDRGHFRLTGLPPGSYLLRASVQSPIPQSPTEGRFPRLMTLSVYAPNKLRRTEAAVITLGTGEERDDVNVVLGLSGMHTVSGQVSSSSASVRSGYVAITDQTDTSLIRRGTINADGTFTVPYVPPGTYTLLINASSQPQTNGRANTSSIDASTRFQPVQESITVADSDLTGLSVTVTPAATASQ